MSASGAPMIFISYRRDDSGGHVGRLYDSLSAHFGRQRLFFDIDHIAPGQDFVQVLESSLSRSSVLLVVIGKRWAGSGRVGARRIDDSGDFVRLEVARGLLRPELRVIPVLMQGARMPGPAALPDDLKDLSRRNAIELSDLRWKEDVARLISSLESTMRGEKPSAAAGVTELTVEGEAAEQRSAAAVVQVGGNGGGRGRRGVGRHRRIRLRCARRQGRGHDRRRGRAERGTPRRRTQGTRAVGPGGARGDAAGPQVAGGRGAHRHRGGTRRHRRAGGRVPGGLLCSAPLRMGPDSR